MGRLKGNAVLLHMYSRTTRSAYRKRAYVQQPLENRAKIKAVSLKNSAYSKLPDPKTSTPAASLQNRQDLIQNPILLISLCRQRHAKQVLARIHTDDLVDDPALQHRREVD